MVEVACRGGRAGVCLSGIEGARTASVAGGKGTRRVEVGVAGVGRGVNVLGIEHPNSRIESVDVSLAWERAQGPCWEEATPGDEDEVELVHGGARAVGRETPHVVVRRSAGEKKRQAGGRAGARLDPNVPVVPEADAVEGGCLMKVGRRCRGPDDEREDGLAELGRQAL